MAHEKDLVPHYFVFADALDPSIIGIADNIIIPNGAGNTNWMRATSIQIGEWRSVFRTSYIRWALAINGLHIASDHYNSRVKEAKEFVVQSLRVHDQHLHQETITSWPFNTAADQHISTPPIILRWAIVHLYENCEAFVFDIYRTFLDDHPLELLGGKEFSSIRKQYRKRDQSESDALNWQLAWGARFNSWRRKRIYDGIDRVLLAYFNHTHLKAPSFYKLTTTETWAESMRAVAVLRNALAHGHEKVPKELAEVSNKPHSMTFDFEEGDDLVVKLYHLQGIECFCDQLLTAINLSLLELYKASLEVK